jgi:hypothetical protein
MQGEMSEQGRPTEEPARDVLAAEAFAVPARDPALTHGPVVLPDDPSGITEPHDILAAEEFAMPAATPRGGAGESLARRARRRGPLVIGIVFAVLTASRSRRRRSR